MLPGGINYKGRSQTLNFLKSLQDLFVELGIVFYKLFSQPEFNKHQSG